jgi:ribosome-associated toxin RatA of RatAB toxin-antitoxin module
MSAGDEPTRTIQRRVVVDAGAEWLFDLTQDYSRRLDWDPFLSSAELYGEKATLGARSYCVSRFPRWGMETEYIRFQRPEVVAVKMTRGPWILTKFAGSWRFNALAAHRTEVTFRYTFATRSWVLLPVATAAFARDTQRRLDALRTFARRHAPER